MLAHSRLVPSMKAYLACLLVQIFLHLSAPSGDLNKTPHKNLESARLLAFCTACTSAWIKLPGQVVKENAYFQERKKDFPIYKDTTTLLKFFFSIVRNIIIFTRGYKSQACQVSTWFGWFSCQATKRQKWTKSKKEIEPKSFWQESKTVRKMNVW